jgi:hypothetical protein
MAERTPVSEPDGNLTEAKRHQWTPEEAAEMARLGGLASAEARKRRATMTPKERAIEAIRDKGDRLIQELLNAALGEGDFHDLELRSRTTALMRCTDYLIGKPTTMGPLETASSDDAPPEPDGFTIEVIDPPERADA